MFRRLRIIVYNKTRKLCGHQYYIDVSHDSTILEVKQLIEEATTVPHQIQWIVFGVRALNNTERLSDYGIRDGYTLYSVPTFVEDPSIPNL
ncbi:ubiquitin family protein [Dictyocaulus viviparus]|uniref:Ubiquitin family protein n=1 Tax=Dictyocaulus viviparus TaxID=29172 RepID=A0A0D8XEV6_DICVI|nr:ubiquitin family protein [Dictyocaulus viviparus]